MLITEIPGSLSYGVLLSLSCTDQRSMGVLAVEPFINGWVATWCCWKVDEIERAIKSSRCTCYPKIGK